MEVGTITGTTEPDTVVEPMMRDSEAAIDSAGVEADAACEVGAKIGTTEPETVREPMTLCAGGLETGTAEAVALPVIVG